MEILEGGEAEIIKRRVAFPLPLSMLVMAVVLALLMADYVYVRSKIGCQQILEFATLQLQKLESTYFSSPKTSY